jgi:hypothetical protein
MFLFADRLWKTPKPNFYPLDGVQVAAICGCDVPLPISTGSTPRMTQTKGEKSVEIATRAPAQRVT